MGRLYIPAENEVSGPWLLGHENLETLDILFKQIDTKLKEALEKTIENEAKQQMEEDNQTLDLPKRIAKLKRKYNQKLKFAEIKFADGTTYEADDIESVLNYVDTNSTLTPTELYIRTKHGNSENEFDLIINSNAKNEEEVDFEYRIKCIDEEIQQKIKSLIDKWIRENKSHRLLQLWSGGIVYFIWFVGFLTILGSAFNLNETLTKTESYKSGLKKEVGRVIEKGISPSNADSALLLLLKLQSDYIPDNVKAETTVVRNKGAWEVFIVSLIVVLVSLIRPKTILGIGKKYNKLKLYKTWIGITYATLGLLITSVIADRFLHFIQW